jgi:hypothetical protein
MWYLLTSYTIHKLKLIKQKSLKVMHATLEFKINVASTAATDVGRSQTVDFGCSHFQTSRRRG